MEEVLAGDVASLSAAAKMGPKLPILVVKKSVKNTTTRTSLDSEARRTVRLKHLPAGRQGLKTVGQQTETPTKSNIEYQVRGVK